MLLHFRSFWSTAIFPLWLLMVHWDFPSNAFSKVFLPTALAVTLPEMYSAVDRRLLAWSAGIKVINIPLPWNVQMADRALDSTQLWGKGCSRVGACCCPNWLIQYFLGSCDCGNDAAWKRDGSCSRHKTPEGSDPAPDYLGLLSEEESKDLRSLLRAILTRLHLEIMGETSNVSFLHLA